MEEKKNLLEESESDDSEREAVQYRVNLVKKRNVQYGRLPWGTWVLEKIGICNCKPSFGYVIGINCYYLCIFSTSTRSVVDLKYTMPYVNKKRC